MVREPRREPAPMIDTSTSSLRGARARSAACTLSRSALTWATDGGVQRDSADELSSHRAAAISPRHRMCTCAQAYTQTIAIHMPEMGRRGVSSWQGGVRLRFVAPVHPAAHAVWKGIGQPPANTPAHSALRSDTGLRVLRC